MTQYTRWESDKDTDNHYTKESQEVVLLPAGDQKAAFWHITFRISFNFNTMEWNLETRNSSSWLEFKNGIKWVIDKSTNLMVPKEIVHGRSCPVKAWNLPKSYLWKRHIFKPSVLQ